MWGAAEPADRAGATTFAPLARGRNPPVRRRRRGALHAPADADVSPAVRDPIPIVSLVRRGFLVMYAIAPTDHPGAADVHALASQVAGVACGGVVDVLDSRAMDGLRQGITDYSAAAISMSIAANTCSSEPAATATAVSATSNCSSL